MPREPQNPAHGKGDRLAKLTRAPSNADVGQMDIGIALSIYGKGPEGELIALNEASDPSAALDAMSEFDAWPTSQ